jgi:asparagine synthetase B (glutamine-hydrolysing)
MRSSGPRASKYRWSWYSHTNPEAQPPTYDEADSGAQPLVSDDGNVSLAVNGEIYNHRILRKSFKTPYNFKTKSDCEVIIPLVCEQGRPHFWILILTFG